MYMSAIGLWRVSDDEKEGKLCAIGFCTQNQTNGFLFSAFEESWNLILDDRLCRGSDNRSTAYLARLRSSLDQSSSYEIGSGSCNAAAAMLDPEVASPAQLPLLLSSFLPLSHGLQHQESQQPMAAQVRVVRRLLGFSDEVLDNAGAESPVMTAGKAGRILAAGKGN